MPNVVVTGASRGLGLGVAHKLTTVGYNVIGIARRDSERLSSVMRQVERSGQGSLHFRPCDLANISDIPDLAKRLRREFGAIYALVNNAGLGTSGVLATMHDARIELTVRLNTVSPLVLTKYVARSMMANAGGRIVNVGSIVGFTGYSGLSVYGATKAAIIGFTRCLSRELGPLGINVNAVAPGFVDTEMTRGLSDEQREQVVRRSALRRLAEVDDIANAVEFLLSGKARNITGTVMTIDAGKMRRVELDEDGAFPIVELELIRSSLRGKPSASSARASTPSRSRRRHVRWKGQMSLQKRLVCGCNMPGVIEAVVSGVSIADTEGRAEDGPLQKIRG